MKKLASALIIVQIIRKECDLQSSSHLRSSGNLFREIDSGDPMNVPLSFVTPLKS